MKTRIVGLVLCLLMLVALPLPAFAANRKQNTPAKTETPKPESVDAKWLRSLFPKLRSIETTKAPFGFDSAPETESTRAVLNKKGESVTIYRFNAVKDAQKCKAMIKGCSLVYGGTVYPGSEFASTYYYNAEENLIALYCGADDTVNKTLQKKGYQIKGTFGGYFDDRHITVHGTYGESVIMGPSADDIPVPRDLKDLRQATDSVYIATVRQVPERYDSDSKYELKVTKTVRGEEKATIRLGGWPGEMRLGRSYVVCIKQVTMENGSTRIKLADGYNKSAFEINDKDYVLPIREYGMKAPVELDTFLKSI